jgi:hypothetical protein
MAQLRSQAPPPSQNTKPAWRRTLEQFVTTLGAVAAIIGISDTTYESLRKPEIHVPPALAADPFALRISLHNPSRWFAMKDMHYKCTGKRIVFLSGTWLESMTLDDQVVSPNIEPGHTLEYRCPFDRVIMHPGDPVVFAQLTVLVYFKTGIFDRDAISEDFTWSAESPQWTEGELVN